jgi:ubiquinone/menaquinone biosynthesis C-methylase UbiE
MTEGQDATHYSGEFFDVWDIYRKVVVNDYMSHRALADDIRRVLTSRFSGRPFSLLDLGCGDASVAAPIFREFPLVSYRGVDLSNTALSLAAVNLKALSCLVDLAHEDMLSALTEDASYDVIYTSFVLHHLSTEDKGEFFRRAASRLTPGGLLLLVDVAREENETLPAYLDKYCKWVRSSWDRLSTQEREAVCEHLSNNDRPELVSRLESQARAAGLTPVGDATNYSWHRLLCFGRN